MTQLRYEKSTNQPDVIYIEIDEFNELVKIQIRDYPEQENKIREHAKCIIKNIEYIKNQNDELYKCPCSMEGHVNHVFTRYITSSLFGF